MSTRKRPYSDAGAHLKHERYEFENDAKRRNTTQNGYHQPSQMPTQRHMAPPTQPTHNDSESEPYDTGLASNSEMPPVLLPSPGLRQKPNYPSTLQDLEGFFQDGQDSLMRPLPSNAAASINSHPGPWIPIQEGTIRSTANQNRNASQGRMFPNAPMSAPYWRSPASEIESSNPGGGHRDSGYYSHTVGSASVIELEPQASNLDSQSLTGRMNEMELPQEQRFVYPEFLQPSQYPFSPQLPQQQHSDTPLENMKCPEQDCNHESKNPSNFKKHKLRHEKPFCCDVKGCPWTRGFQTTNDLDRHKSSKHGIITKAWMCAVPHCPKKGKRWPRADNFRQHIKRLHPGSDVQEIMDKSWELACSKVGNGIETHMEPPPQEAQYFNENYPPYLVTPQDLALCQNNNAQMNDFSEDHAMSSYSVDESQEATCPNSVPQQKLSQYMELDDVDPALYHHQPGMNQQTQSQARDTDPIQANPDYRGSKAASASHLKPPIIHHSGDSSNNSEMLLVNSKARDHSSSKSPGLLTDEVSKVLASTILDQLGMTGQPREKLELTIRTIIKANGNVLVDPNKGRKRSQGDSPSKDSADPQKPFQCPECVKRKKTQCELTKHIKRHTRPYGCTHTSCPRRFGSKNDWKRHENTMHWQIEAWKCAERNNEPATTQNSKVKYKNGHQCGRVFYRREQFQAHLSSDHRIADIEYIKGQCKARRVGRNGQRGFWCGFCMNVITLQRRGLDAWDERFDHIDKEHFQKNKRVEDWYPMDKELPKGLLKAQGDESGKEELEDSFTDVPDGEGTGSDTDNDLLRALAAPQPKHEISHAAERSRQSTQATSGSCAEEVSNWICCQCNNSGVLSCKTDAACCSGNCFHKRCPVCKVEYQRR